MAVTIPYAGVTDLLAYFTSWTANYSYDSNGFFNPDYTGNATTVYTQWGAGTSSDSSVLLEGSWTYTQGGNFNGTINSLTFGQNIVEDSSGNFSLTPGLTLGLGGVSGSSDFAEAIYVLSNYGELTGRTLFGQQFSGFYDYFGIEGTVQTGNTASDDRLYSFFGNDTLTGGGATDEDTFVWDADLYSTTEGWGNDTITDFVDGFDAISFEGYGWSSLSDFTSAGGSISGNVISYTDANSVTSTITVNGVTSLGADDFIFV